MIDVKYQSFSIRTISGPDIDSVLEVQSENFEASIIYNSTSIFSFVWNLYILLRKVSKLESNLKKSKKWAR